MCEKGGRMTISMEDFLELRNRVDKLEKEKIERDKEELKLALNQFYYCTNLTSEQREALRVIEKHLIK